MDLRKVKKLIELAQEAGLAELEVSSGDESVRISMAVAKPTIGEAKMTPKQIQNHKQRPQPWVLIKPWCQRPWRVRFIKRPIQRLRPLCRLVMWFSLARCSALSKV